jgi:N-acetylglucosamine kinase-like BadF-type ATPase
MILLADSGSTKTTWTLMEDQRIVTTVQTAGMNPYFITSETVEAILNGRPWFPTFLPTL